MWTFQILTPHPNLSFIIHRRVTGPGLTSQLQMLSKKLLSYNFDLLFLVRSFIRGKATNVSNKRNEAPQRPGQSTKGTSGPCLIWSWPVVPSCWEEPRLPDTPWISSNHWHPPLCSWLRVCVPGTAYSSARSHPSSRFSSILCFVWVCVFSKCSILLFIRCGQFIDVVKS